MYRSRGGAGCSSSSSERVLCSDYLLQIIEWPRDDDRKGNLLGPYRRTVCIYCYCILDQHATTTMLLADGPFEAHKRRARVYVYTRILLLYSLRDTYYDGEERIGVLSIFFYFFFSHFHGHTPRRNGRRETIYVVLLERLLLLLLFADDDDDGDE